VRVGLLKLHAVPPFWFKATVPVNPLTAATVIVELAVEPTSTDRLVGLAETVKSTTWNVTGGVVERVREPLVPLTVTP
jgi:hypothetical protein